MRKKLFRKIKQNHAFTMMEMLITVAVMTVLLGISVVGISRLVSDLKMTELDNYAKTIYLETQNQMAAMEVEGSLSEFYKELVLEDGSYYGAYKSHRLSQMPQDYDEVAYGNYHEGLYYFTSTDSLITTFMPLDIISSESGMYLIELNPETGDVYGVFYWEKANTDIPATSAEIYAYIQNMETKFGEKNNRTRNSRMQYEIGYYGGAAGAGISHSTYQLDQKSEIINGEELYLKLSYNYNKRVIEYLNGNDAVFQVDITIKGKTSGAEYSPNFRLKDNYVIRNGRIETGFLLDGMGEDQSFAKITEGEGFLPGEEISISVKTRFQYEDVILKESEQVDEVNSLFGEVNDDTVKTLTESTLERTIKISSVRHLRNLGEQYYNGDIVVLSEGQPIDAVHIVQTEDIDFSSEEYVFEGNRYTASASRPLDKIEPIQNTALFENTEYNFKVSIDGTSYVMKKLVVQATQDNAGLFARIKNVDVSNIKLEDYILQGANLRNVGALAGTAIGGSVCDTGVYLAPYYRNEAGAKVYYNQELDAQYGTVMAKHYATMGITGGTNVGGLIGSAEGTYISDCFAAVQVEGNQNVGGLIGASSNQTILNSYATGTVRHLQQTGTGIGGFIGFASNVQVNEAYAAGDVYGAEQIGGFVGSSDRGYYQNASSYGRVQNINGFDTFPTGTKVGGFISEIGNNDGNVDTLGYLFQVGYNANDSSFGDAGLKRDYTFFTNQALVGNTQAVSYPYDGNLLYKAFPFKLVTSSHYGDWPYQYYINNALVYYEKYEDDSYGYYSVTKLTDTTSSNTATDDYVWVLDSLRDETCIEDGYALLSMFYLDSVEYSVYQFNDGQWGYAPKSETDQTPSKGTLKVSIDTGEGVVYGEDKMVLLRQQGSLVFNAYEATEKPYSANYKGKTIRSSFSTNGMYLYQLPYELQNTYRYNVDNFYDVIVFDEGYAVGNLKNEDENEVGGTPVVSDEVYYYSPHFARLAINPGLGISDSSNTADFVELEAPDVVYVRSARQLNALGRVPYYWNDKGGGTALITYEQQVDINFSTYANQNGQKLYCGKPFDLLAFDTEYANQPIGQRASDSGSYGAFQNDYNGNYHKIIDYCVKSSNQYVGLFGEIYKKNGATAAQIQNVVMLVSDTSQESNAGRIIGTYQEKSNASGNNRQRTGVGALVGSDYTVGQTDGEASVFTVYNCAVAGYEVEYHITPTASGYQQPLGIALGGMIGYSRGNVAQSTANNDVKLVAQTNLTGDEAAVMIGGFTGSAFFGTTLNCYAGGSIDVDDSNGTCYVNRLRIGGFCPGWMDAPGIENTSNSEDIRYQNIYSFTRISDNVWSVRESANGNYFNHMIPTVSRMRLYYEWRLFNGTKWHTDSENGSKAVRVPGFSYYLTTVFTDDVMSHVSGDAREYFERVANNKPKTCDPVTYTNLSNFTWVNSNNTYGNEVKFIATGLYPQLMKARGDYPFPAFNFIMEGDEKVYVHYGDWPMNYE